jgi:hypothetical protein
VGTFAELRRVFAITMRVGFAAVIDGPQRAVERDKPEGA